MVFLGFEPRVSHMPAQRPASELLLFLKEVLTKLPTLALNSLHNSDKPATCDPLASVSQVVGITGLHHQACAWFLLRAVLL